MKNLLLLGGNGFIGSVTCKSLLDTGLFNIWVVNRGKSWDWDTNDTIKPFVKCIKFNRDRDIEDCKPLVDLSQSEEIHAIVDFSGYESNAVKDVVKLFKASAKLYVYISSDSIYEVCEKSHSSPSKEIDANRPSSHEKRKQLKKKDSYGHKKLKCEEVLAKQFQKGGIPYLIFRLADVIGAKDSTERWWQYQLWIQAAKTDIPIFIPQDLRDQPISVVYVNDVATLITDLLSRNSLSPSLINSAYNLGCTETITLKCLLQILAQCVNNKTVNIQYSSKNNVPHIYPSVELGPIDNTKAISSLGFRPTKLSNCISEIAHAYELIEKDSKYTEEKKEILSTMKEDFRCLYEDKIFKILIERCMITLHMK